MLFGPEKSCPLVQATFMGKDKSMGFEIGETYILRLVPKDKGLMAVVYPNEKPEKRPLYCPYANFAAFMKNWGFKSESAQYTSLFSVCHDDAKKLFQENKELAARAASLQDELNILRAKYSEAADAAEEKEQVYAQDRDNMGKVSQDMNRRVQELTEQLQIALNEKKELEGSVKLLSFQIDDMQLQIDRAVDEKERAASDSERSSSLVHGLLAQGDSLSKAVENLTTLLFRRDNS